jgi:hypothetical protein
MSSVTNSAAFFADAVSSLRSVPVRDEIEVGEIRPPQGLAPYAFAVAMDCRGAGAEHATGRLILLYDPEAQAAWGDEHLRIVAYIRAEVDAEVAVDPLLPEVGWSWLTEALEHHSAACTALGGTVTRTSSSRFGAIPGDRHADDVELRASWTPLDQELAAHGEAFCEVLAVAGGLPPVGVKALGRGPARGDERAR